MRSNAGYVAAIITMTVVLLLVAWKLAAVLLLLFAALLVAALLDGIGQLFQRYTPLRREIGIIFVLLLLLALIILFGGWVTPRISEQVVLLQETLMEAVRQLRSQPFGQQLFTETGFSLDMLLNQGASAFSSVTGVLSHSLGVVTDVIVVIVVGIYIAFSPQLYRNGIVKLMPQAKRSQTKTLLVRLWKTLKLWLIGRLTSMLIVTVLSTVGLMILGVPLAFLLGLLAGLFAFVPIVGPAVALIPPALVAFSQSPQLALYVFLLYMGIQFVESYLITPLIQEKIVAMPPAVLIMAQVALGVLFGVRGILLASPLAVVVIVLIKSLYIEGVLGDHDVTYAAEI